MWFNECYTGKYLQQTEYLPASWAVTGEISKAYV